MQRSNNSLFYGFLAVLLTGASFFVCWLWIIPNYQQNTLESSQLSYEVDAATDKLASLKTAKNSIDSLGDIVNQMIIAVPPKNDTESIITTLEAIAAASQTYIPSFQIADSAETVSTSSLKAMSVTFSVSGTFENLTSFVRAVEDDIKYFNVNSVTLSGGSEGMSMTLQLEAYVQKNTSSINS